MALSLQLAEGLGGFLHQQTTHFEYQFPSLTLQKKEICKYFHLSFLGR